MKWLQNGNLAKLVAFFVIAIVISCTVSFAANGWQSFTNDGNDNTTIQTPDTSENDDPQISDQPNDIQVVLPPQKYYHPITGLETDLETSLKRPLCFVFSSSDPLYGISSSYLTIELPTEYGNTRFLCFTDDAKTLGKIGSLAPSRGYISNIASYFGGILLSYGFDDAIQYDHDTPAYTLDFEQTVGYCYTEYNSYIYTNADLVNAFINNSRVNVTSSEIVNLPYSFPVIDETIAPDGESATNISITFSEENITQFGYSSTEGGYILSKNSSVKKDLLNDSPLIYKNLFLLYSDSTTYETEEATQLVLDTCTKGSGIFISNGKYVEISWERDLSGNLIFFDAEGNQITVNRGSAYIGFIKSSRKNSIEIA